jgi:hypothetical protein
MESKITYMMIKERQFINGQEYNEKYSIII